MIPAKFYPPADPLPPRLFVVRPDGSGYELLSRDQVKCAFNHHMGTCSVAFTDCLSESSFSFLPLRAPPPFATLRLLTVTQFRSRLCLFSVSLQLESWLSSVQSLSSQRTKQQLQQGPGQGKCSLPLLGVFARRVCSACVPTRVCCRRTRAASLTNAVSGVVSSTLPRSGQGVDVDFNAVLRPFAFTAVRGPFSASLV